jgi:hypothetical protein
MDYSLSILGHDEYWDVYSKINDSINVWKANDLEEYRYFGVLDEKYKVDSILCVNKNGDKLRTSILLRLSKDGEGDEVRYFYGVKIKGVWCFFIGEYLVLPREYYQEDIHTPLSFEEIKQIVSFNLYRHYLRKNGQGEWEVNERFFSGMSNKNMTVSGYGSCFDCKTEEEYYMYLVKRNWSRKK